MKPKINNFVAKHMHKTVRPTVEVDRKKQAKLGYEKYQQIDWVEEIEESREDESDE